MKYARTTRTLALSFCPGGIMVRTVQVPAGATVESVEMGPGSGRRWVVYKPTRYAGEDSILRHDLWHHYLCVPDDAVEEEIEPAGNAHPDDWSRP